MSKLLVFGIAMCFGILAQSATANSCRFKAAQIVVQDLNQNGRLWEARQLKSGEVEIMVKGKVWLDMADEEVHYCDAWDDQTVCVDYKFQDPETRRVEHIVQLQIEKDGCIKRGYNNLVGKRPWR